MTHQGQRSGDTIHIWLYARGAWPRAERAAAEMLKPGERLERVVKSDIMYEFSVHSEEA